MISDLPAPSHHHALHLRYPLLGCIVFFNRANRLSNISSVWIPLYGMPQILVAIVGLDTSDVTLYVLEAFRLLKTHQKHCLLR